MTKRLYKNQKGIYKTRTKIPSTKVMGDTSYNRKKESPIPDIGNDILWYKIDSFIDQLEFGEEGEEQFNGYIVYYNGLLHPEDLDKKDIAQELLKEFLENEDNIEEELEYGWNKNNVFYAIFKV